MRGTHWPTTSSLTAAVHGAGSKSGTSTTFVSSRPSTSTLVTTKRLSATGPAPGHVLDGEQDVRIGTTAAEISAHADVDLGLRGRPRAPEQSGRGEQLAGRTESALQRV